MSVDELRVKRRADLKLVLFSFRGYSIHVRTIDEDAPEDKAVSDVE